MKGYIYLIENKINNKKYIGKTYNSIESRWKEHIRDARKHLNRPLYQAINKYGVENFSISLIEYVENLEEREKYWINHFDSYKKGYNATLGGDGKTYFEFSEKEVLDKYKELNSLSGTVHFFNCDIDTIRKRLVSNGIEIPKGGDIHNEKRSWKTQKVEQYTLEEQYMQSFDSYSAAARWLIENENVTTKIKHIVSNISGVCRGIENRKKAYNYIWKIKK